MGTVGDVGALSLPLVATGTQNDPLEDPVVDLLLAFVGHVLTADIDPKLADLPAWSPALLSCPATNRFGYDPMEPRANVAGFPVPALWIWWDGVDQVIPYTTCYSRRMRDLKLLYLAPELPQEAATVARRGLVNAVAASIARWLQQLWHPTFGHNGKPAGQLIPNYVADLDRLKIGWKGGTGVPRVGVEEKNQGKIGAKQPGRDWPGFAGVIEVDERVDSPGSTAVDLYGDAESTVQHDGLEIFKRRVYGPNPDDD